MIPIKRTKAICKFMFIPTEGKLLDKCTEDNGYEYILFGKYAAAILKSSIAQALFQYV